MLPRTHSGGEGQLPDGSPRKADLQSALATGDTLAVALAYRSLGVSVFPIDTDGKKKPAGAVLPQIPDPKNPGGTKPSWEPFRDRFFTDAEARRWWSGPRPYGIGAVGGAISANLAELDFETGAVFEAWVAKLSGAERVALSRCPVIRTPSGGRHVWCRLPSLENGQCYARTATGEVLIEVRGRQHYVVAPGSPAACHPDGRRWEVIRPGWLDGGPWEPVPFEVWYDLITYAAALTEYVKPAPRAVVGDSRPASEVGARPGDHFNARRTWEEILSPRTGWRAFRRSGAVTYWTRPNKCEGVSASTGHCRGPSGHDLFYVFSTSAAPFEAGLSYSRFAVFTLLYHHGDYRSAALALARHGCGASARKAVRW